MKTSIRKELYDFLKLSWILSIGLFLMLYFQGGLGVARLLYLFQLLLLAVQTIGLILTKKGNDTKIRYFVDRTRTHLIGSSLIFTCDMFILGYLVRKYGSEQLADILLETPVIYGITVILALLAVLHLKKVKDPSSPKPSWKVYDRATPYRISDAKI